MVGGHLDFLKKKKKCFFGTFGFGLGCPPTISTWQDVGLTVKGPFENLRLSWGHLKFSNVTTRVAQLAPMPFTRIQIFRLMFFGSYFEFCFFFFNYFPKVVHAIRAKKMPKVSKNRLLSKKPTNRGDIEAKKRWGGT